MAMSQLFTLPTNCNHAITITKDGKLSFFYWHSRAELNETINIILVVNNFDDYDNSTLLIINTVSLDII